MPNAVAVGTPQVTFCYLGFELVMAVPPNSGNCDAELFPSSDVVELHHRGWILHPTVNAWARFSFGKPTPRRTVDPVKLAPLALRMLSVDSFTAHVLTLAAAPDAAVRVARVRVKLFQRLD